MRWGVAGNIVTAWIFTIPMAGLVGAIMELITRLPAGDAIVFALAIAISWTAFMARRWETRRLLPPELPLYGRQRRQHGHRQGHRGHRGRQHVRREGRGLQ